VNEVFKLEWAMADPLVLNKSRRDRYKNKAGIAIPSVTGVLGNLGWNKNALNYWANSIGLQGIPIREYKSEADCGTIAHYFCECFIKQNRPDLTKLPQETTEQKAKLEDIVPRAQNAFMGFLDWQARVQPNYIQSELKLISERYQYGGTLDIIARVGSGLTLIDLKSSKGVYADFIIQLAAYLNAARENGYNIESVMLLQLGKEDGTFMPHPIQPEQLNMGFDVFQHLLPIARARKVLDKFGQEE